MLEYIGKEKVIDWYYLEPYTSRKSFYKKAVVYETEKYYYLQSYSTLMCRYVKETREIERLSDAQSMTTSSHLGSFFKDMYTKPYNKQKFYKQEKVSIEEDEITEEWMKKFEEDYNNLSEGVKKRLAESGVVVTSKEEAEALMKISQLFSLLI